MNQWAAANTTDNVNNAMALIFGISLFLFVAVIAAMVYFAIAYNRKNRARVENIEGSLVLEVAWTVIPLIIVMGIFWIGYSDYLPQRSAPKGAEVIDANAVMWAWSFGYDNGYTSPTLKLPLGKPVKIVTHSVDVIHSFYVPQFKIKQDAVPNHKNHIVFTPTKLGKFNIFCAEYCGKSHANMLSSGEVVPLEEYLKWKKSVTAKPVNTPTGTTTTTGRGGAGDGAAAAAPLVAKGAEIYKSKLCSTCHSLDGSTLTGPSWKGIWGHEVKITGGSTVKVDEAYIRESILHPDVKIVEGYENLMPAQELTDDEIKSVIEYIKTLK